MSAPAYGVYIGIGGDQVRAFGPPPPPRTAPMCIAYAGHSVHAPEQSDANLHDPIGAAAYARRGVGQRCIRSIHGARRWNCFLGGVFDDDGAFAHDIIDDMSFMSVDVFIRAHFHPAAIVVTMARESAI